METIKFQLQTLRRHRWNYNIRLIVFDFPLFSGILNNPSHAIFLFQLYFTCIFRWSLYVVILSSKLAMLKISRENQIIWYLIAGLKKEKFK